MVTPESSRPSGRAHLELLTIALCLGRVARHIKRSVVWWGVMSFSGPSRRVSVAAMACCALLALGIPAAGAAPAFDGQGYIDSTARCSAADTTVAFGSTQASRVAICQTPGGRYQYRGVRVRDGAKLIIPASRNADGAFVAENDGVTYTVTSDALVVTAGGRVLRREPMTDFHGQPTRQAPGDTSGDTSDDSAGDTSGPTVAPTATPAPETPRPLSPPLPAEVGGTSS